MTSESGNTQGISVNQLRAVLTDLTRIPNPWLILILAAAVTSCFGVTRSGDGLVTVQFGVSAITAGVLTLIWLPALLRIIALGGGGLKSGVVEASTPGLSEVLRHLRPEVKEQALPPLIATVDIAESSATGVDRARLRNIRRDLQNELGAVTSTQGDPRARLMAYAAEYERLRSELPAGPKRTFAMSQLVAAARAVAPQARLEPEEVATLLTAGSAGERLVALAVLQALPSSRAADALIRMIARSNSAFEQFHALVVLERLAPSLTGAQRRRAVGVLDAQRSGEEGAWITPDDPSRWELSSRILSALRDDKA